eukprot:gb/GECG01001788.1/.p1 GENE.gb/GECG01001788.1/~~gb/GECG01001788.1/.p1  ORF type:complete len:517 (+),score=53.75 gb/GECG01001788.1/:1-1551(+)
MRWLQRAREFPTRRGWLKRYMGTKPGSAIDRIDHLSIYADDKQPLLDLLRDVLGLHTMIPRTSYAFGENDTPFELELLHLGSGVGIEVYTDPSLQSWREKMGKPNCTIANVGLTPAYNDIDRTTSLMLRRGARFEGAPVVYHFTDEQREQDPSLPRWLFKKFPIRIGDASFIHDDGAKWASRMQDIPQLTYFYLCMWHKDLPSRPAQWRSMNLFSPMGPYGITGCNRIFWSVPDDEDEMSKLAMQFHRMNVVVNQLSAKELTVMFPEGPQLHIVAESAVQRKPMMGRISGIELAVSDWEYTREALRNSHGFSLRTLSPTEGFAEAKERTEENSTSEQVVPYNVSPVWMDAPGKDTGALPLQGFRFILDTEQVGCPGMEVHFVPSNKLQLRLSRAAAVQSVLSSGEAFQGQIEANQMNRRDLEKRMSQVSSDEGLVHNHKDADIDYIPRSIPNLPEALTLSGRTASKSQEFTNTGGRTVRYNDRRPVKTLDDPAPQEEKQPPRIISWLKELFVFNRL